jgi:hypothetical protein
MADTSWHDECRRLRADGLSLSEIGRRLGVSADRVAYVLDENGYRARRRTDSARRRGSWNIEDPVRRPTGPIKRETISQEAKDAAIRAFAKQEITREELMRRITPRDKWRGRSWFPVEAGS